MKAKSTLFRLLVVAVLGLASVGIHAGNALAMDLHQAKVAGYVGEQPNGYLGVVPGAPGDAQSLVSNINAQRRAAYQRIAQSNGTSLAAVEQLAGQKAIAKTPSGQYILSGGSWVRK